MVHCTFGLSFKFEKYEATQLMSIGCIFPEDCHSCTALSVVNLAQPHWININCTKPITFDFMCNIATKKKGAEIRAKASISAVCPKMQVKMNKTCLSFVSLLEVISQKQRNVHRPSVKCYENYQDFSSLSDAISSNKFPSFVTCDLKFQIKIETIVHIIRFEKRKSEYNSAGGMLIFAQSLSSLVTGNNLYKTTNKAYVSAAFACLDINQNISTQIERNMGYCKHADDAKNFHCQELLFATHDKQCHIFLFQQEPNVTQRKNDDKHFTCNTNLRIKKHLQNDLVVDCHPEGEDEVLLSTILNKQMYYRCQKPHQIPCRDGHPMCYNMSEICTFKLGTEDTLLPCRTGEHLANCRTFECNMMFKCPKYYCIPWKFICDGKWHCPSASDESVSCEHFKSCENLFKCGTYALCLHLTDVCDGVFDCPLKDDEFLCTLHEKSCPTTCLCLTFAVSCKSTNIYSNLFGMHFSPWVTTIKDCHFEHGSKLILPNLVIFSVIQTNLENICNLIHQSKKLLKLVAAFNDIKIVENNCFISFPVLKQLKIDNNNITTLQTNAFNGLSDLCFLNLSGNPLAQVTNNVFSQFGTLEVLSLRYFSEIVIADSLFDKVGFQIMETNHYHICCILPQGIHCTSKVPWHVSCSGLLPTLAVKSTFYVTSFFITLLNILSIDLQRRSFLKGKETTGAPGLIAGFINSVDFICSVPLIILWTKDLVLKGQFVFQEEAWKGSSLCYITFCIFFMFNLLSPVAASWLSISRYMVVKHPLDTKFKETNFVLRCIGCLLFSCIFVSCIATVLTWILNFYVFNAIISSSLCSPFIDPFKHHVISSILTWILVLVQLFSMLLIIVFYTKLVLSLRKSQEKLQTAMSKAHSNTALLVQLTLVTSSTFVCWIPCATVYLVSMFMREYPIMMIFWVTVTINPINSIVNPILFIVFAMRKLVASK